MKKRNKTVFFWGKKKTTRMGGFCNYRPCMRLKPIL